MAVLLGTIKAIMKESIGTIESMAKESMYQAKENSLRDHGKMAIDKAKESSHLRQACLLQGPGTMGITKVDCVDFD